MLMKDIIKSWEYDSFIIELTDAIIVAKSEAIVSVNKKIIDLYCLIWSKVS